MTVNLIIRAMNCSTKPLFTARKQVECDTYSQLNKEIQAYEDEYRDNFSPDVKIYVNSERIK